MQCSAMQCFVVLMFCSIAYGQYYDSFTGREMNRTRYEEMERVGLVPICALRVNACDTHAPRRMDLSCNNLQYPSRGTAPTSFTRMLPPVFSERGGLRRSKSGQPLPPARALRVALMSDGRRPHGRFTHMLANFNVFIAGDTTSVHDTVNYVVFTRTCCQSAGDQNTQCMPVEVKDDDLHLRRSNVRCMNLTRAITFQQLGCVPDDIPLERINLAAPMLELSSVYGHGGNEAVRGREYKWGRLRTETINGKEWPPTGGAVCVSNVPPRETRCHDSPSPSSNALLGINLVFMWFYRSHNAIAAALREASPCWDDDKLYYTAREINIAYFVQIMYYEMMPELFGWEFLLRNKVIYNTAGHVDDYDPEVEPRITIEHATATRWFHTLQEGTLNLYRADGRLYGSVQVVDMILRTGALPLDGNIEGMTQGSFRQPGAAQDELVDPDIGERVLGRLQFASDVISSDIMKGRDFGLPPYNQYRKACGLPEAKKFKDLLSWMDRPQVEALATFYEHPDDIDLLVALLAEKSMPDAELGPTLACIMTEQMLRWRRADRFWFEHTGQPGAFTLEQLREIRKMTLAKLLCQHGDSVNAIQPQAFLVLGDGNEITDCTEYDMPDLSVFRDDRCYPHPTPRNEAYQQPTPRNEDHTTLQGYLTQIFNTNQYNPISYADSNPYVNEGYNDLTILTHPNRPTNKARSTQQGDPTLPTIFINKGDSTSPGYISDSLKLVVEPTITDDPITSMIQGHINSTKIPNRNPGVNLHPNVNPIDPIYKTAKVVSITGSSNLDSKSRNQILYSNIHPAIRNRNNPFEEFLQNYWQSANSFKPVRT